MLLSANVPTGEVGMVPGLLAYTGPLDETLPRLRELGYGGVEFITVDPKRLDPVTLEGLLEKNGMKAVAVNTGRLCGELGLTLSNPDGAERERARRRVREVVDFAGHWGVPINVGILRGNYLSGVPRDETFRLTAESLREICEHAAGVGVGVLIETVCFMQGNFINTLAEAVTMLRAVDRPGLGVMYDFFQMFVEERDMYRAMADCMPLCGHVHFADSNRLAPGRGGMDYPRIIAELGRLGYAGPASVEIRPEPDQDAAAEEAARFLLPLLGRA